MCSLGVESGELHLKVCLRQAATRQHPLIPSRHGLPCLSHYADWCCPRYLIRSSRSLKAAGQAHTAFAWIALATPPVSASIAQALAMLHPYVKLHLPVTRLHRQACNISTLVPKLLHIAVSLLSLLHA
ncbi:hypothetical protein ABBQ38_15501 [Trebouxia sp. C0009 RCD-2024]